MAPARSLPARRAGREIECKQCAAVIRTLDPRVNDSSVDDRPRALGLAVPQRPAGRVLERTEPLVTEDAHDAVANSGTPPSRVCRTHQPCCPADFVDRDQSALAG